jgi:hypothetical protein
MPVNTYEIVAKFNSSAIVQGFGRISDSVKKTEGRINASAKAWRNHETTCSRFYNVYNRNVGAMRDVGFIWRSSFSSLRVYTDEYMKLAKAQGKFKAINLSDAENAEAFAAVKKTVNELKGLRLDETTESITDLHGAFGDLHHAIDMLPMASKFRFAFNTLFGDKFTPQQLEEQIQNAMKYLEVTGAVAQRQAEMERRFNAMAQITAATGGRVTPADMLQAARRGGPAAQGLSLQGMRNMATLIPELGGEGTGTALMSSGIRLWSAV